MRFTIPNFETGDDLKGSLPVIDLAKLDGLAIYTLLYEYF